MDGLEDGFESGAGASAARGSRSVLGRDAEHQNACVAVGMGSNEGDRLANLCFAARSLRKLLDGIRFSGVYETEPVELEDQRLFLNACCTGKTGLTPVQLLSELQHVELLAGRRRIGPRYGPRTLDLDLLLYGSRVITGRELTVPHPRMRGRAFVLLPLAELIPDVQVPASGGMGEARIRVLAARVPPNGVRRLSLERGLEGA